MQYTVNTERLLSLFLDLVKINAISRAEKPVADFLVPIMSQLGASIDFDNAHLSLSGEIGNMFCEFPGTVEGETLLFSAHMDTVQPTENLNLVISDDRIMTDGTTILGADDRAGIAAIIEMIRTIKENSIPHPPIEIIFNIAEEIGLMGSQFLDYSKVSAKIGFIPDTSSSPGAIIYSAPAQKHLKATINGKASHAGMAPQDGISAITALAKAIARMPQGKIDNETTANVGIISGGKATNIIADKAVAECEARSRNPEKLIKLINEMQTIFIEEAEQIGAIANIEITDLYPSFKLPLDTNTIQIASQAAIELGLPVTISETGGGSDANFFNGAGIKTVIIGTGMCNPHSTREYILKEDLYNLSEWMLKMINISIC
ncbi:MAG: M20/M25/M40 family metallo-hydrolase [bacterium]